jgi:hypothetical protein
MIHIKAGYYNEITKNGKFDPNEQEATFSSLAMIFAAWITLLWGVLLIPALIHMKPLF